MSRPAFRLPTPRIASARAAALCYALAMGPAFSETGIVSESQIKAAFVYSFTKFVEWPAERFGDGRDPLVIGVMGENLLAAELQTIVRGRKVNGRSILVQAVRVAEDMSSVHVLFVGAEEDGVFAAVRGEIEDSSILTVGETPSFAAAGGTINFVLAGTRLRFEIDMSAAERAGLKISAQLQELATVVKRAR